jgi:hypothetical protein
MDFAATPVAGGLVTSSLLTLSRLDTPSTSANDRANAAANTAPVRFRQFDASGARTAIFPSRFGD